MISDTLQTLRIKLKEPETLTIITEKCAIEIDDIIENRNVLLDFCTKIQDDFCRFNTYKAEFLKKKSGKFETLPLNKGQLNQKKAEYTLCCYKFKKNGYNNKNIRCIFITDDENGYNILVHCFVEKATKDYHKAIDIAIQRCNELFEVEDNDEN